MLWHIQALDATVVESLALREAVWLAIFIDNPKNLKRKLTGQCLMVELGQCIGFRRNTLSTRLLGLELKSNTQWLHASQENLRSRTLWHAIINITTWSFSISSQTKKRNKFWDRKRLINYVSSEEGLFRNSRNQTHTIHVVKKLAYSIELLVCINQV